MGWSADAEPGMLRFPRCQEFRQLDQITGHHCHRELRADAVEAAVNGLGHAVDGLGPTERFLDLLPAPLGQGVAKMLDSPPVDGGMLDFLRDMGRHDHAPEIGDEVGAVVSLIRPKRQAPGRAGGVAIDHLERRLSLAAAIRIGLICMHHEAVAVLHQRMPHETQRRCSTRRLLVTPRIGTFHGRVRGVRALLAPEAHFGVAGLAGCVGHRLGLGLPGRLIGVRRGLLGRWRRWAAWIVVVIGWRADLRLETLHGGPRLDQGVVHREMLVRQQRLDLRVRQDRGHDLARHFRGQQPVEVHGEHGRDPHGVVAAEPDEPSEQQIVIHLFHQQPLRANREEVLEKARPDQARHGDRGVVEVGAERGKLGIGTRQRVVHDLTDLAQRMMHRDALLTVHIAEKRPARLVRPAHRRFHRHYLNGDESGSRNRVELGVFQKPLTRDREPAFT